MKIRFFSEKQTWGNDYNMKAIIAKKEGSKRLCLIWTTIKSKKALNILYTNRKIINENEWGKEETLLNIYKFSDLRASKQVCPQTSFIFCLDTSWKLQSSVFVFLVEHVEMFLISHLVWPHWSCLRIKRTFIVWLTKKRLYWKENGANVVQSWPLLLQNV